MKTFEQFECVFGWTFFFVCKVDDDEVSDWWKYGFETKFLIFIEPFTWLNIIFIFSEKK